MNLMGSFLEYCSSLLMLPVSTTRAEQTINHQLAAMGAEVSTASNRFNVLLIEQHVANQRDLNANSEKYSHSKGH